VSEALKHTHGRALPGSLCLDGVVIVSNGERETGKEGARALLLAHRVFRVGGDRPDCWSASFEENFAPVSGTYGGRYRPRDEDLTATAIRGLKEELVSLKFNRSIQLSFQAVSIELPNLNLQLIAVMNLPDTSFSDVKILWPSDDTPDNSEHDVLGAMKLNVGVLRKALSSRCPAELGEDVKISNPDLDEYLNHPWHPRSLARIACCLWMLEEGYL